MKEERTPMLQTMDAAQKAGLSHLEDTPAYNALMKANLLNTQYRKARFDDIFTGDDMRPTSSKANDCCEQLMFCSFVPILGCLLYQSTHTELFVPAGSVGMLEDDQRNYIFAQPGMHNIRSLWIRHLDTKAFPTRGVLHHGNRAILVVEQGYVGLAFDNGQPILFPPGLHVWTSETMRYKESVSMDTNLIKLGPYTLLTVDEGYAAVTQNNGKQQVLPGGCTHLLSHKNWRFEKFLTLKIQTDDLEEIEATSADNITMKVTSTVTWKIVNPTLAATMAAETMSVCGGKVSTDIRKLRTDVLKQGIASLASFMGGVNYSDSFHMAATAQGAADASSASTAPTSSQSRQAKEPEADPSNPLYDSSRMTHSVAHANATTMSYGVHILSINILSALPIDSELTNALACGAVASAEALQAETSARGNARAMRIDAEAQSQKRRIEVEQEARSETTVAEGKKQAAELLSHSQVAMELAKMDKSATLIGKGDKFFFGQDQTYLSNLVMNDGPRAGTITLPKSRV